MSKQIEQRHISGLDCSIQHYQNIEFSSLAHTFIRRQSYIDIKILRPTSRTHLCHMSYYHCSTEQLRIEAQRRGFVVLGTRDQLSEALKRDDEERGSDATTVTTEKLGMFLPRDVNLSRTAEFGQTTPANFLVGESM